MAVANAKKIYQYDLQGNFITDHKNQSEAAVHLGRGRASCISAAITGKVKTAYGYQWSLVKHDKMKSIAGKDPRCMSIERLSENLRRELPLTDHGIVDSPGHREHGKHKIKLGTMEIYFRPGKPIGEIVEKYSRVTFD